MKHFRKIIVSAFAAILIAVSAISASAENVVSISGNNSTDYVKVAIDGSFDDWKDKPYSKIQYPWDTGNNYHLGALFRDDKFVYLHVKMSNLSYTRFNGYNYRFTIDGKEQYVVAVPPDGTRINENGSTQLLIRDQNGYSVINNSSGVLVCGSGKPDEWEIKIPLTFFSSNPDNIKTITFYCSNLGPQELVATGTPTLPFVLAGAGLIIASAGYYFAKRKSKKCCQ